MWEEQTEIATWDGISGEHFFLLDLKGAQELNSEIMEPQRGQIYICNTLTPQIKGIPSATYLIEHT